MPIFHRTASGIRVEVPDTRPNPVKFLLWNVCLLGPLILYVLDAGISNARSLIFLCVCASLAELSIVYEVWIGFRRSRSILELDRTGLRAWDLVNAKKAEWPLNYPLRIQAFKIPFSRLGCIRMGNGSFLRYATNCADYADLSRVVRELREAIAELRQRELIASRP
jgi:hypothetical protein